MGGGWSQIVPIRVPHIAMDSSADQIISSVFSGSWRTLISFLKEIALFPV